MIDTLTRVARLVRRTTGVLVVCEVILLLVGGLGERKPIKSSVIGQSCYAILNTGWYIIAVFLVLIACFCVGLFALRRDSLQKRECVLGVAYVMSGIVLLYVIGGILSAPVE